MISILSFSVFTHFLALQVDSSVIVKSIGQVVPIDQFIDEEANFGPIIDEDFPLSGRLVVANPIEGCVDSIPIPENQSFALPFIALIKRGNCSFDHKVRAAEASGYAAAIIFNDISDDIFHMSAKEAKLVTISSVMVGLTAGLRLKRHFSYPPDKYLIEIYANREWDLQTYIIPVLALLGLFLIGVSILGAFRFCEQRRRRQRRCLTTAQLSQLPLKNYIKVVRSFSPTILLCYDIKQKPSVGMIKKKCRKLTSFLLPFSFSLINHEPRKSLPWYGLLSRNHPVQRDELHCETCAICLEDYTEGDKVRILPCDHVYHSKCVDPWLLKGRRVCPICKRTLFRCRGRRLTLFGCWRFRGDQDAENQQLLSDSDSLEDGQSLHNDGPSMSYGSMDPVNNPLSGMVITCQAEPSPPTTYQSSSEQSSPEVNHVTPPIKMPDDRISGERNADKIPSSQSEYVKPDGNSVTSLASSPPVSINADIRSSTQLSPETPYVSCVQSVQPTPNAAITRNAVQVIVHQSSDPDSKQNSPSNEIDV